MDRDEFAASIDHTVLGPETTWEAVRTVLDEAAAHGMNACIPPCYVAEAAEYADAPETVATVVGFPHGQHTPGVKRDEAVTAWEDGADEVDLVINVGRLKAGEDDAVTAELSDVVAAVPVPVKVIVETAILDEDETRRACEAAVAADADMVKTSTGFAADGATVADVELLSEYLPVKAAGGIGSYEEAAAMIDAGAVRIGTAVGVAIVEGYSG
ncbi:deoxyribose-phosphate aldolase [Halorubrum sp. CBA1125]|uniref:deoxyribose-phosphate aldolase n=1 Tax=Halorubrum sp. CBA1125 TaxID=2668072 RepID=UPI0012E7D616|nr:deoxyribose-phosphate aldolase [Halorubrum sp. CBA1125]MUW14034.1 deoxyribose-phosphate aldolase [Halorubrum sp. CBA1125]